MSGGMPDPKGPIGPDLKSLIGKVAGGATLTRAEAEQAFDIMMSGDATPAQMGGFLIALTVRRATVEEIAGAATVVRSQMTTTERPPETTDISGPRRHGPSTPHNPH